ncbi:MAG: class I SAM-dependent methyltransferase [Cytophagaceae bacterium]
MGLLDINEMKSKMVEETLQVAHVHHQWKKVYHSGENEKFFEKAFDYIIYVLNAEKNSTFLHAGCGTCAYSNRLANRGFYVEAVDFSESVLEMTKVNIESKGLRGEFKFTCRYYSPSI